MAKVFLASYSKFFHEAPVSRAAVANLKKLDNLWTASSLFSILGPPVVMISAYQMQ